MSRRLPILLLALFLLPACQRGVPNSRGKAGAPPRTSAATPTRDRQTAISDRADEAPPRDAAPAVGGRPAAPPGSATLPPRADAGERAASRPRSSPRGSLTIQIYGTPLDYILHALTIENGAFHLDGQGMRYVGRISRDWEGAIGRPVAIEPMLRGLGQSELDLPQVGRTPIVAGQLVLDEVVSRNPPRVKGRLSFTLQGPDGPATFAGSFEVGVVTP